MASVASKNLYELLGNTSDEDPDREVPAPVVPVDKPVQRTGKRNAPAEAPVAEAASATRGGERGRGGRGGRGGRRGDLSGSEGAFRDREAGRENNREKPVDDGLRDDRHASRLSGERGQRGYERRGGRGGSGRGGRGAPRDDRHSRGIGGGPNDHAKQAAHGWGDATAGGELNDEQTGAAIATEEEKAGWDTFVDTPINGDGDKPTTEQTTAPVEAQPEPEEEDKTKSYVAYLAELAEKKLSLGGTLTARQANEGSSAKVPEGKEIAREDGADYFAGSGGKAKRERERKDKNVLVLDHDIQAREREAVRGGRGGSRGGRGRGEGGFRGEGRGRSGRGRGEGRGEARGENRGRGGNSGGRPGVASPNVTDTADFPSLGGK